MAIDGQPELRRKLAIACRILASAGLVEDVLGHVSARVADDHVLVRCRGPRERGLAFTTPDDIRLVSFDGGDPGDGYSVPNELPIHVEMMRADPDVHAVVHAHPPAVIAADLAGVPLLPLVGAYNIPAARLAADGIPVYPRGVLIRTPELAAEMVAAMGDKSVCVLRGHGVTTTGATIEQAGGTRPRTRLAGACGDGGGRPRGHGPARCPTTIWRCCPTSARGSTTSYLFRHHEARLGGRVGARRLDGRGGDPMTDVTDDRSPHPAWADPRPHLQRSGRLRARTRTDLRTGVGLRGARVGDSRRRRLRRASRSSTIRSSWSAMKPARSACTSTCASTAACRCAAPSRGTPPTSAVRTTVGRTATTARSPGCRSTRMPTAAKRGSRGPATV